MNTPRSRPSRRAVLGGIGVVTTGVFGPERAAGSLTGAPPHVPASSMVSAPTVIPTIFRRVRLPAAAFRPRTSTAIWQMAAGALSSTGPAVFTAPVALPEADLVKEVRVELDPAGQSGAITFARHRLGVTEVLVAGVYPASTGVTTVALPLPARPHLAEPSSWSYDLTIELTTGVSLHSALVESIGGTASVVLIDPVRVYDTRDVDPYKLLAGVGAQGKIAAGEILSFSLQGIVPNFCAGALVNVTLDQTERSGFLTVYGPGENGEAPAISNINWYASSQIVANLVVTKLGGESTLAIKVGGGGRTHLIVDVLGYLV